MQLIDSHCHLDDARFDQDRDIMLMRAAAHGIDSYIVPAVSRSSWPKLQALTATHHTIYPAYGLHPWFCPQHNHDDLDQLPLFLEKAVAVGECGLDGGRADSGKKQDEQLYWFRAQLDLALAMQLPVIIHAYKAVDEVCRELRRRPALTGVIHGFSGSIQQAEAVIAQGFYLGFGSNITYPQNKRLQTIVNEMPLERLLIESDAPDQPPYTRRGQRNEPAFLLEIVQQIATLRTADTASIADRCNRNARELFRL